MFKPVASKVNFPKMEQQILQLWKERRIFQRSVESRRGRPLFVLYEGPPTANASPGIHHVLARVFKDVIPRYKTMKGDQALRKGGWDTHGLPVELEVERELGLGSKPEIEAYGVAEFNKRCRQSVLRYVEDWEKLTERIGFWLDMDQPYTTFDNSYIESCWWIVKQLWDKGLIYQGYKVTPHCPRCVTSLSSHEVALGYKDDVDDPSIYIKFRVVEKAVDYLKQWGARPDLPTYLLAWTTTPWTLPGNTALAVAPDAEYAFVEIEIDGQREQLILAQACLKSSLIHPYQVLGTCKGRELAGIQYEPLYNPKHVPFDVMGFRKQPDSQVKLDGVMASERPKNWVYPVIAGEFVSMEEGTGIVHIAPAFGEVDLQAGQENELYFLQPVDLSGRMTISIPRVEDAAKNIGGRFVKDADPLILADLKSRGLLYRSERIRHTYPFCWRCETPLLYYAKSSWYIKTTAIKETLISANKEINWYPEHIKYGRFGDWLENNVDWAFSRERYWGTPLPIWQCQGCGYQECIESRAELRKRKLEATESASQLLTDGLDLHRPFVDEIFFECAKCGGTMRRVPEVIDCWFDSGAMPIAQWHYPFENRTLLEDGRFPADYICEALDQTRGWFYSLHALSTLIFSQPCFRNVICLGHILDSKGEKMSKSKGNVVDPWLLLDTYGADPLRWYLYTSCPPGNVRRFSAEAVAEVVRKFLLTLWNTYSFFVTYANIDKFDPSSAAGMEQHRSDLDRWILSELNQLILGITQSLDNYDPTGAGRRVESFIDNLSNWYVRRSRRRFWKSENDADKLAAYATLYECLVTLTKLLAPFTPFIAEEMYQNLVRSVDETAPESVHLADFPVADLKMIDEQLSADTQTVMKVASLGRAARSKASIKVRQPLAKVVVRVKSEWEKEGLTRLEYQVLDELNVKEMRFSLSKGYAEAVAELVFDEYEVVTEGEYVVGLDTKLTQKLVDEGLARELVRRLQTMRRSAGFDIANYIVTYYQGNESIQRVVREFGDYIKQETLSRQLIEGPPREDAHVESHRIQGNDVILAVKRQS